MADSTPRSESGAPAPVAKKMDELRLKCENQVEVQLHGIEEFTNSFHKSMESVLQKTQETVANQAAELGKLKAKLREEEDALVKAIAEKTRKEARKLMLTDSVSSSRVRGDELDRILQDHRARKDKCSAVIVQQCRDLLVEEEKRSENSEAGQIQEAISWYNRALGFRIDCGHGIKFTFTNIHPKNSNQEFSFTIHHSNDTYTVLQCEPHLNGIEPLVQDLNKTNGLFKFVRTLRELFLEAVVSGVVPQHVSSPQEASVISNPVSLMSSDTKSESQTEESDLVLKIGDVKRVSKKLHRRGGEETILSPGSASLPRRSPRLMHSHGPRTQVG
ncbi:hypothetical protein QQ045_026614 [Rhodiola kirilowii]